MDLNGHQPKESTPMNEPKAKIFNGIERVEIPWLKQTPHLAMTPGYAQAMKDEFKYPSEFEIGVPEIDDPVGFAESAPAMVAFKLLRHFLAENWGLSYLDFDDRMHDYDQNNENLRRGEGRIVAGYDLAEEIHPSMSSRVWVILEADHSAITFLLPEEY
jgi:hypothetical protein